jgi:hypothetical protein
MSIPGHLQCFMLFAKNVHEWQRRRHLTACIYTDLCLMTDGATCHSWNFVHVTCFYNLASTVQTDGCVKITHGPTCAHCWSCLISDLKTESMSVSVLFLKV